MKLKTLIVAIAATFCALFATGCADSPTDVVEKWRDALVDGDVEKANEYSTTSTHTLNAFMVAAIKEDNAQSKEMIKKMKETKYVKEEIDGDTAKVWAEGNDNPVTLKKVDNKWKVDAKK